MGSNCDSPANFAIVFPIALGDALILLLGWPRQVLNPPTAGVCLPILPAGQVVISGGGGGGGEVVISARKRRGKKGGGGGGGQVVISAREERERKKRCSECQCEKQASLLPSQLFPFPSTVLRIMQPKGKHERPQNTSSVKQLSKTASTVHKLYRPETEPLYLWCICCTAHHRGANKWCFA